MNSILSGFGATFGPLFAPIGTFFHYVFYEPVYNLLMYAYYLLHFLTPVYAYGLAIIVLTLVIRSALIPLTVKQLKSSRAMQVLAPQLNELKRQYRNDPQGLMQAQRELYREHGVSQLGGCLPALVQLPVLYGLFYAFYTTLRTSPGETYAQHLAAVNADIYPFLPHLSAVPQTHFLWMNLAVADPTHILPIIAGILTFIQLKMAMPIRPKLPPGTQPDATTSATQSTQYIMPLITVFFAWQYAAGLALYWTVSTLFSAVQQYFLTGWGSLAVVPGFDRILPPPTQEPGRAVTSFERTPRAVASASEPVLAGELVEEAEVGIIGWFKRMSKAAGAQPEKSALVNGKPASRNGTTSNAVLDADTAPDAVESTRDGRTKSAGQPAPGRDRRTRKDAPLLVKPVNTPTPALEVLPEQEVAEQSGVPEQEIAGEASGSADGRRPMELPEVALKRDASGNGNGNGNGTRPHQSMNGAGTDGMHRSAGGPRKGPSGRSSSSTRARGGRAKGGR